MAAAYECITSTPVRCRKSTSMEDKADESKNKGDIFLGTSVVDNSGMTWLKDEDKGVYVPFLNPQTQEKLFQPVQYTCTSPGNAVIRYRKSLNMDDKADEKCEAGKTINALIVKGPDGADWLQDTSNKLYLPLTANGANLFVKGQLASVAPGQVQMTMALPAGVPPGSIKTEDSYRGQTTCIGGVVGCCCCGLPGCLICAIPLDKRMVWIAPDGRKFSLTGRPLVGEGFIVTDYKD